MEQNIYIKNKKAYFEYHILDKYVAGIKLLGTEIKSIRDGHKALKDLIFGTTVNSVRHMVNVPVLVVKPQKI